jgi:hypothetical protein
LLECVRFSLQRAVMLAAVRFVYPATITESVLLGDPEIPLSRLSHLAIISAVFTCVPPQIVILRLFCRFLPVALHCVHCMLIVVSAFCF